MIRSSLQAPSTAPLRSAADRPPAPRRAAGRPMRRPLLPALLATVALAACGGGGQAPEDATPAQSLAARGPAAAELPPPAATAAPVPPQAAVPAPTPAVPPAPTPTPVAAPAPTPAAAPAPVDLRAVRIALGDRLFDELALSASGRLSCASCHDTDRGHADPQGSFLPLGGADGQQQGLRSSPSLRYLNDNRAFHFNAQGRPVGGFMWDGRAASRTAQALLPLLDAAEMANLTVGALAARLRALPYVGELRAAFALGAQASDEALADAAAQALADYQAGDPKFQSFSSKFDAVQDGRAAFSAEESRGRALFTDAQRGNCASCHSLAPPPGGTRALFTDFSYHALGVPRNRSQATADPAFFDLGLCGPKRTDLAARSELCGQFRVPTLRNVALSAPYFHNGAVATLEEAVSFYATRDSDPVRWYPVVDGQVDRFNDLPPALRGNVTMQAPFGPRPRGAAVLSPQDVRDLAAFLRTLSDGFTP